ncbi:hypothetical protein [Anderseniella sp. Alg231-50]|uniref:hypothetical protein n=1 Tax=Anderseniella sp. Alg231-50 TaxID=1922226 RepID=UPI00307B134B
MMKIPTILFLCCAVFAQPAFAASGDAVPAAASSAAGAEGFVAAGWSLEHRIATDLNADGLNDLVMIVRQDHEDTDTDEKPFDAMRRQMLIAFRDKQSDQYRLVHQDNALIPARETVNVEDYLPSYKPLETKPAGFSINLELFMSAGGWETELRTFQFEYRNGHVALVAFDSQRTNRSSGKTNGVRIDYLAGLAVKSSGNIQDDPVKEVSERLAVSRLYNLQDIGPAFEFNPFPETD